MTTTKEMQGACSTSRDKGAKMRLRHVLAAFISYYEADAPYFRQKKLMRKGLKRQGVEKEELKVIQLMISAHHPSYACFPTPIRSANI